MFAFLQFPPLQLPVNPIQSAGDVGSISTFDEEKILFRREKQRARLQRRASEWWRAGGGVDQAKVAAYSIASDSGMVPVLGQTISD